MPSNKELTEEALALGKTLGVRVETQGLNNNGLTDLVARLKADRDKPTAPTEPPPAPNTQPKPDAPTPVNGATDDTAGGPPAPKPKKSKRKYEYQIAEGRSLTCNAGILGPGSEVLAKFFGETAQEDLLRLVKIGCVVHTPELARKK